MTPSRPARILAWITFVLVMLFMTLLTGIVMCFFLPFVVLKAFWVLLVQPLLVPKEAPPQEAGSS